MPSLATNGENIQIMYTENKETLGSNLTPLQQQRFDLIFPVYGKSAESIVQNVYGKGSKSWSSFLEKMDAMQEAKPHLKGYYNSLYDAFDLNQVYAPGQVIGIVNEVRRQMGLNPYTEKIKIQSEYDFNAIFLVEDVYNDPGEGEKRQLLGYKPVAKVKPE
ncbi:MAG: hypothetical protein JWQ79_2498 [Mucilaginibacter sp.]|nr:hypothetical protein [Mucilaginibacter sp.]